MQSAALRQYHNSTDALQDAKLAYDTTWTAALALKRAVHHPHLLNLTGFQYKTGEHTKNVLMEILNEMEFVGVSVSWYSQYVERRVSLHEYAKKRNRVFVFSEVNVFFQTFVQFF